MKWSFRICEINGTQVRVHVTFFLLLAWFGLSFFFSEGAASAFFGVLFILVLFACVVLHEFGHATAARYFGIRTPDITLLPIGGVARLERMPRKPHQELIIAIAGPLVNVFIASVLLLVLGGMPPIDPAVMRLGDPSQFLPNLLRINIMLVLFNLVPAFPMDGGRMFRAVLAMGLGYARATQVAASVGQLMAILFGVVGILTPSPILLLIAVFIFMAAGQEAAMVKIQDATEGLPVTSAMITEFRTLRVDARLQDAVEALLHGSQHDFPVLDARGDLVGILTRKDLIPALSEHGKSHPIKGLVKESPPLLDIGCSLSKAFEILSSSPCPTLPVMESDGKTVAGILTAENVGEMIMIQSALTARRKSRPGAPDAKEPAPA